jgi:hypothetical protein
MRLHRYLAAALCSISVANAAGEGTQAPAPPVPTPGLVESYQPSDPDEVERYWTKERMEAAKPMPFPRVVDPSEPPRQEDRFSPQTEGPPIAIPGRPPVLDR